MKDIKAIVGILLIFALGAVAGTLVTRMVYENRMDALAAGDVQARNEAMLNRLSRNLDLDSKQQEQVLDIIREIRREVAQIKQPQHDQVKEAVEKGRERIRKILRPDQLELYEKIIARNKAARAVK